MAKKKPEVPMSENVAKIKTATKEELIENLRGIAEANPDAIITRNYYRVNSPYAESAWNGHFGTFEEFKRLAGIKLTRHQRRMEMDVAKHASAEPFRLMNIEKRQWGSKYLRPDKARFQTVLIGSDVHDIECDPFWKLMFLEAAKRIQPEKIVLNGDIFDMPEFGKYGVDPREWDVVGRIRWVHAFLDDLRKVSPNAEIVFIEGNHEHRLLRHLAEATPAMKAILADLHGWSVPELLGLSKYEINYVANADLATFTKSDTKAELKRNWTILYDFLIAHHFPEGERFGMPGWNGHHHKHHVHSHYSPILGAFEWHQIGSGHKREAVYCNGELWTNGFLIAHVDTVAKRAQFEYVDTTHDHCVLGGKWYQRAD